MWYITDLMDKILESEAAQRIIDYVSDVYGESYVGLWLFQVIGIVIDDINTIIMGLFDEIFPETSEKLLPYWEKEYGIIPDDTLTIEERRANIKAKMQMMAPINPAKLENILSDTVEKEEMITEVTGSNKIIINVIGYVDDLTGMREIIERLKPAHVIYEINTSDVIEEQFEIKYRIVESIHAMIPVTFS